MHSFVLIVEDIYYQPSLEITRLARFYS